MADSSYEKGLTEISRMKVADLKTELKKRNLSTAGNKQELIDRLQSYIHDVSLSLDETNEEILDEDAVLEDVELDELVTKSDSQEIGEKRKLSDDNVTMNAKKIILNRNPIIEEVKVSVEESVVEEKNGEDKEAASSEKKIIKLSELSAKERLEMRAKKFGVPLTDAAKKEARLARFNSNNSNSKSADSIKTPVSTSYEVLKKRAERFGSNVSSVLEKADQQERIEKRKARFGEVKSTDKVFPNKIKIIK